MPSAPTELEEMLLMPWTAAGRLPRDQVWRALLWGGGLGVLGVMTGYAVFIAWVAQERDAPDDWWVLLAVVLVVAVIAVIGEQARHIIVHGAGAAKPAGLKERMASILAGFVIVLLFELANTAWDKGGEKLYETLEDMLGLAYEPAERRIRLLVIVLVWVASGALVAVVLVRRILSMQSTQLSAGPAAAMSFSKEGWKGLAITLLIRLWQSRALREGLAAAFIAMGICATLLLVAVIVVEGLHSIYLMIADNQRWQIKVTELAGASSLVRYLAYPALWLDALLRSSFGGSQFLHVWFLLAYGVAALWRFSMIRAVIMFSLLAVVFVPPVAIGLFDLVRLSLIYALLWGIPAFVLGATSPYLREYRPTQWGRIACLVALGLALLAVWQASIAGSELLGTTAASAVLALLIGLLLIFTPPTREYLPLVAVVCGLLSYGAADLLARPTRIIEQVVFLNTSHAKPEKLDAGKLKPPSGFVMPWEGEDWEIGSEVYGRIQQIAAMPRGHERWQETHQLAPYLSYLREPERYQSLAALLKHIYLEDRVLIPYVELLYRSREVNFMGLLGACPPGMSMSDCKRMLGLVDQTLCPGLSRIECLVALANPAKVADADKLDWTLKGLREWVTRVSDAVEADLQWRWADEAIGVKLHIGLSGAIGFFLALAALIAWQIRNAHEGAATSHS